MKLIEKWNAYMGPKDERLAAESDRFAKIGYFVLIAGAAVCCYYGIMLDQVSTVTERPIYTELGAGLFRPYQLLLWVILASCVVVTALELRAGIFSDRSRLASVDKVPWDYVVLLALLTGATLFVLAVPLRIIAEIQIVGLNGVMWFGDFAIGIVYFSLGFVLGLVFFYGQINSAIKRRRTLEAECEE